MEENGIHAENGHHNNLFEEQRESDFQGRNGEKRVGKEEEGNDGGNGDHHHHGPPLSKFVIITVSFLIVTVFGLCIGLIAVGLERGAVEESETGRITNFLTLTVTQEIVNFGDNSSLSVYCVKGSGSCWQEMNGTFGVRIASNASKEINLLVQNSLDVEEVILHAHGQVPPSSSDGVPYISSSPVPAGRTRLMSWKALEKGCPNGLGSYYLHSHFSFQSSEGLTFPFILEQELPLEHPLSNVANKAQEVVMFINELCPRLEKYPLYDCNHQKIFQFRQNAILENTGQDISTSYKYILVNGKPPNKPLHIQITKREISITTPSYIKLKVINSASISNFMLSFGGVNGTVLAADGQLVQPYSSSQMWISVGQRLDILVAFNSDGNYPITATVADGSKKGRTVGMWIDLQSPPLSSPFPSFSSVPTMSTRTEVELTAFVPISEKLPDKFFVIWLTGEHGFHGINGTSYQLYPQAFLPISPNPKPLLVSFGDRVHIEFHAQDAHEHPVKKRISTYFLQNKFLQL